MKDIFQSLGVEDRYAVRGEGCLPSRFAVTRLATASIAAVGLTVSRLLKHLDLGEEAPRVSVDQRLASLWFTRSLSPVGWELPPLWDSIAGDYQGRNGWIKLHTNLPHHRAAALSVVKTEEVRSAVSEAIATYDVEELETAIVGAGGVAAALRSREAWLAHPQGAAVASEPLIHWGERRSRKVRDWAPTRERPLAGLRVLDLTRVLAGPVATRALAGFGAEVLRVDPPGWDEANVVPDITLGKRCSRLDLKEEGDRETFLRLLSDADILVHGYRPDALEGIGLGQQKRLDVAPHLIEVCLDAYGWTGPWAKRRGFDSLVQMSSGIAEAGMAWAGRDVPTPLPVQALDHATGYLMTAAVVKLLCDAVDGKGTGSARLSLARTAELLKAHEQEDAGSIELAGIRADYSAQPEFTLWGPAQRLKPALQIEGTSQHWTLPACDLGSSEPCWA